MSAIGPAPHHRRPRRSRRELPRPKGLLDTAAPDAAVIDTGTYAHDILDKPRPSGDPQRVSLPIASDDAAAKQVVTALLDEIGFDTVDAGGQDESWRQQPGTPVYGLASDAAAVRKALDAASPERTAEWRA